MDGDAMKDAACDFLRLCADGDVDAAWALYVGPGFRHHNAWFAADADALKQGMADNARDHPGKSLQVRKLLRDGDEVAVLSEVHHVPGDPGYAVLHVFRFVDGRIVELWDLGQPLPAPPVNANGAF